MYLLFANLDRQRGRRWKAATVPQLWCATKPAISHCQTVGRRRR